MEEDFQVKNKYRYINTRINWQNKIYEKLYNWESWIFVLFNNVLQFSNEIVSNTIMRFDYSFQFDLFPISIYITLLSVTSWSTNASFIISRFRTYIFVKSKVWSILYFRSFPVRNENFSLHSVSMMR